MLTLTNHETDRLRRLLDSLVEPLREAAADQAYRRDACRYVRERILTDYHDRRHHQLLALVAELEDTTRRLVPDTGDLAARRARKTPVRNPQPVVEVV